MCLCVEIQRKNDGYGENLSFEKLPISGSHWKFVSKSFYKNEQKKIKIFLFVEQKKNENFCFQN